MMRKSKFGKIPYVKVGVLGTILVFLLVVGFVFLSRWEKGLGLFPEREIGSSTVEYDGATYVLKENTETFLVLGLDQFEGSTGADSYNNNKQADFIMLLVFDNDAKQYTAIHINRDTIVDVNVLGVAGNKIDTVKKQIALSHTYGNGEELSCHNTADSVSSLLMGVKVDHFASVTLDAVTIVNDLVGGVEVVVLDDFSGVDDSLVKGETVTLMGEQALTYVRSRHGMEDSTNSNRMNRQQQYIKALYEAFLHSMETNEEFVVELSLQMSEYMISDRSVTQMQALADKLDAYEFLGVENIEGESVLGEEYMEFHPDEDALKKMIINLFYTPKK